MAVQPSTISKITVFTVGLTMAHVGLLDLLDQRERQRVDRAVAEADRARFLLGAALLRTVASSMLDLPAEAVTVDRACSHCGRWHGRPRLPGTALEMSVSHSGSVVTVAALPGGGRVGVDVERTGDRPVREVVAWTIAEAQFKAGGGSGLTLHRLPPPAPRHVLTLATNRPAATVEVVDATTLLPLARHVQQVRSRSPYRARIRSDSVSSALGPRRRSPAVGTRDGSPGQDFR